MLDRKFIRENIETVEKALKNRQLESPLDRFQELEEKRRDLLYENEKLRHKRNVNSGKIGELKREGKDASHIIKEMQEVADKIKEYDEKLEEVENKLDQILLKIPNIPHGSVPVGIDEEDNRVVKKWGEPREFDFKYKAHWDIGEDLDILDFEKGS
ncbi:MAG: serine--tRNA ligase, partial [archaeon]